jgi:hypothetical protein
MNTFNLTYGAPEATEKIVTLVQAKANSKIDFDDEDSLLELFLDAATAEIENYLEYPVLKRIESTVEVEGWFDRFKLKFPIIEDGITDLKYEDKTGNLRDIPEDNWNYESNIIYLDMQIPSDFGYRVFITADLGYSLADIPADIKRACLLLFAHNDTYRENMPIKFNQAAQNVLRPYRKTF